MMYLKKQYYASPLGLGALLSALCLTIASAFIYNPQVKMSNTGFCHTLGGTYYRQTLKFEPYNSLGECLKSGGKVPSR